MEFAEADNMEKYRKYIQKRRMSPQPDAERESREETESTEEKSNSEEILNYSESKTDVSEKEYSGIGDTAYSWSRQNKTDPLYQSIIKDHKSGFARSEGYTRGYPESSALALRRTDTGLYKRLYQNGRKVPSYQSPYRSYPGVHGEVENNRTTLLAVKLIKQALACFAILGIIVFMQGREDMSGILMAIKEQVVNTHIEPQGIYDGIQEFIAQCSRVLGGSP